jgi:hypothetical protein
MASHKRYAQSDRDLTFTRPRVECFACYDTGIIANGDGLLSRFLPDYDTIPNGSRMTGSDTAIICHCTASYDRLEPDGKVASKGCREGSGDIRAITTEAGPRIYGSEIPKEHGREIHRQRLHSWKETEAAMSEARVRRANGEPDALPWFMEEVRPLLQSLAGASGSRLSNPFAPAAAQAGQCASEGQEAQPQPLTASQAKARAMVQEYDARIAADPAAFDVG